MKAIYYLLWAILFKLLMMQNNVEGIFEGVLQISFFCCFIFLIFKSIKAADKEIFNSQEETIDQDKIIQEFIDRCFKEFRKEFPTVIIAYQYKSISNTHFIRISPLEIYQSDEFMNLDIRLRNEFYELDLDTDFITLNEQSLVELDQPTRIDKPERP